MAALISTYSSMSGASVGPCREVPSHVSALHSKEMESVAYSHDHVSLGQLGTSYVLREPVSTHDNGTSITRQRSRSHSIDQQIAACSLHNSQDPLDPIDSNESAILKPAESAWGRNIDISGGVREVGQDKVGSFLLSGPLKDERKDLDDKSPSNNVPSTQESTIDDVESKWIHRDKLAQIESRELAEMGIQLGLTRRAGSRARRGSVKLGRTQSDQSLTNERQRTGSQMLELEHELVSSAPDNDEAKIGQSETPRASEDAGTQELPQRALSRQKAGKPAVSKIPISKSSPVPSGTPAMTASGSPVQRIRKMGINNAAARNSLDGRRLRYSGASMASSNIGESTNVQDIHNEIHSTPPYTSPSRANDVSKRQSIPSGRRLSRGSRVVSGSQRQSDVSASDKLDRSRHAKTRDGPRLPIARPEGEAPWIATMFKPDPRLPQDQQMLPTHAKRLAMEQGKIPFSPQTSGYTPLDLEDSTQEHSAAGELRTREDDADRASQSTPTPRNQLAPMGLFEVESFSLQNSQDSPRQTEYQHDSETPPRLEVSQWPLPSPKLEDLEDLQRQPLTTPKIADESVNNYRAGAKVDVGHDTVTSQAHNGIGLNQKPSHNVGLSNLTPALDGGSRATRLPIATASHNEDKACGGCCSVM